jgi:hypothetical protein
MARRSQPVEVSTFVAGLITDASPLTFPDNASIAEENFVLNSDGSRERRLGINHEVGAVVVNTGQANLTSSPIGRSSYKWENAGGDAAKALLVVQFGQRVNIFDLDVSPISSGLIKSINFSSDPTVVFSFTEIDGFLVIATGQPDFTVLTYNGSSISSSTRRIEVRDLFGVEDVFNGEDLYSGFGVQTRPSSLTSEHCYNLRNQGWAIPRMSANFEALEDPIWTFVDKSFENTSRLFPSNSDNVASGMFSDASDPGDRISIRLFPSQVFNNPIGSTRAPLGHYIIDLFERGNSRLEQIYKTNVRYPGMTYASAVTSLPSDATPGGIGEVTEFAGRAWFAGFSGGITGGDNRSPRLSSYITFSKLVESPEDINKCYQEADPTAIEQNELVDTDGGFIRIAGAYGIQKLVNIGTKLVVLASNGVWLVEGGSDYGFTATAYKTSKISDNGCRGKNSVVVVENSVMYWSDDGIYHVTGNEFGDTVVQNLSENRIQNLYDSISTESKSLCSGFYDSYDKKVKWIYNTDIGSEDEVMELVLDITLKAYYPNRIKKVAGRINKPILVVNTNPYVSSTSFEPVVASGDSVVAGPDDVILDLGGRQSATTELIYITVVGVSPTISYTFSSYRDTDYLDWKSSDGVGVDAEAVMITGYISGGDFYRDKSVKYIQCYFEQTESLFEVSGDDFVLVNPSSCRVQAQWNWSNSVNSGRWCSEFEVYKFKRHYMEDDSTSIFNTGNRVVVTKNKLRGYGKVVSIKFRTKPGHDLKLYGWSMLVSVESK